MITRRQAAFSTLCGGCFSLASCFRPLTCRYDSFKIDKNHNLTLGSCQSLFEDQSSGKDGVFFDRNHLNVWKRNPRTGIVERVDFYWVSPEMTIVDHLRKRVIASGAYGQACSEERTNQNDNFASISGGIVPGKDGHIAAEYTKKEEGVSLSGFHNLGQSDWITAIRVWRKEAYYVVVAARYASEARQAASSALQSLEGWVTTVGDKFYEYPFGGNYQITQSGGGLPSGLQPICGFPPTIASSPLPAAASSRPSVEKPQPLSRLVHTPSIPWQEEIISWHFDRGNVVLQEILKDETRVSRRLEFPK